MSGESSVAIEVQGSCERRFEPVREALAAELASGEELGASIVVDIAGENVIDIWGGWRDEGRTQPWAEDTIVNVWSATKTVTALATLMLIDRGLVDPFEPVATYWPEFAANGKEKVEVRHLMSHTSGVAAMDPPTSIELLYDWDASTARYAAQAPWWEPGTASGYHGSNYGHLLGEVIRRVTGKHLKQFVAEEIAGPLGADFQIGAAEADWGRIAPVTPPPPLPIDVDSLDPDGPAYKGLNGPLIEAEMANRPEWRRADMGAFNGHGNARSLARMLSAVSRGGSVDGVRLVQPETIELIFQEQVHGTDLVLGIPLRWGIGWALPEDETLPYIPKGNTCYWGGWGGSLIVCDTEREITISYMMNKMGFGIIGSDRSEEYFRALAACLD